MNGKNARIGAALIVMAALVALIALSLSGPAMANAPSKHAAKHAVKHAAKTRSAKLATHRLASTSPAGEPADTTAETNGSAESPADTASQDAICRAAGVDPNGNVQFDDRTKTCSPDSGGTNTP